MAETLQQKAKRLRREAMECDRQVSQQKERADREREEAIGKQGFPRPYWSDDYAGVEGLNGGVGFYYGYEHTRCPKHGDDCTCDDREWCFVAMHDGKDVCVIPRSQLNVRDTWNCMECLIAGIGAMAAQGLLALPTKPPTEENAK